MPEVASQIVEQYRGQSPMHRFRVSAPKGLPEVAGDQDRLRQVLANLIDNAIKFSPEGGLVSVTFRLQSAESSVVASVTDQGIGVSAEESSKLFEPFERGKRAKVACIPGTGLGLYINRSLLHLMDGEIGLRSKLSRGASFWISMPTVEAEGVTNVD